MKAIIWKELRENLMWFVMALIAISVGFTYALHDGSNDFFRSRRYSQGTSVGLCSSSFESVMAIMCITWGAAVGLFQSLPEKARDRWAFLIHRPLSRSQIYTAKVLAGLILYFAAIGIPFLGAVIWVSTPGHLPIPFDWHLTLGGIIDILGGTLFYFAGLLTGLRAASWYTTKALPLGVAPLSFLFSHYCPEFWQALAMTAIGAVVLFVAAWGSFLSDGVFRSMFRTAKAALTLILTVGTLILFGILAMTYPAAFADSTQASFVSEYYCILNGGDVVRATMTSNLVPTSITTLDGKPLPVPKDYQKFQNELVQPMYLQRLSDESTRQVFNYRSFNRYFSTQSANNNDADGTQECWYYSTVKRQWLGFSLKTRRLIGTLGPAGFAPPTEAGTIFDGDMIDMQMYAGRVKFLAPYPKHLYAITFSDRSVRSLFEPPAGETISRVGLHLNTMWTDDGDMGWTQYAVMVGNRLELRKMDGAERVRLPLLADAAQYQSILFYELPNNKGYYLWYSQHVAPGKYIDWKAKDQVEEFSSAGVLRRHFELVSATGLAMQATEDYQKEHRDSLQECLGAAIAPLAMLPMSFIASLYSTNVCDNGTCDVLASRGIVVLMLILNGLACLAATVWICRRYQFKLWTTIVWSAYAFLMGPAGLIVFALIHEWPVRETCIGCKRKRLVTNDTCEHCHAPFPPPARNGTEIIESV